MVKNRLSQEDAQAAGWLLDGYPRSAEQAEAIEEAGIRPDVFILINVRALCSSCAGTCQQLPQALLARKAATRCNSDENCCMLLMRHTTWCFLLMLLWSSTLLRVNNTAEVLHVMGRGLF